MFLGDFAAWPPEIISGQIHAGPGSGSLLEAASAWDRLAAELNSSAAAYRGVIAGLAGESWLGPSSASMAAAVAPYVSWMSTTAAQAAQAGAEARVAAAAYGTVLAATVPPAMIAANRSQLMSLMATNLMGQNSAAIAATEAQYGQMWAQDVAAMVGYANASTATGSRLTLFTKPPQTSSGGAQATDAPGPAATGPLQSILDLINDLTAGYKNFWEALLGAPASALWEAFYGFAATVGNQATWTNVVNSTTSLGIGQFKNFYRAPVVAVSKSPLHAGLSGPGLRSLAGGVATTVSASAGSAPAVGALSVPPSWAGASPAIRLASAALPGTAATAVPGAGLPAALPSEAALGATTGGMLGSPAARVVSSAKVPSKVPTAKRLKEPVQLDRLIECLQEQPDAVQHWTVDEAGLDDLVAELTLKPGIHAVHVLDEDEAAVVPGQVSTSNRDYAAP
ncbi:PPE family protein [Mycolicibacter heraklionensis]|uniref:PPE family protein n=1 Tax=Mycolicibacter heraklionensis TaxID=512402 RepID=A0A9X7ZFP4_9MYCO|nr:PPE family protein [Mycolicibacter heraklionensis]QZA08254.1 PPE family protein [Mycolicibacter heraklionensis]